MENITHTVLDLFLMIVNQFLYYGIVYEPPTGGQRTRVQTGQKRVAHESNLIHEYISEVQNIK